MATRVRGWGAAIVLVAIAGVFVFRQITKPAYGGKDIEEWFEQAIVAPSNSPDVLQAFRTMEGEAIPFLMRKIERRHSWWVRNYPRLRRKLPRFIYRNLPRQNWNYDELFTAMELLGTIGQAQRFKMELGEPIRGKPISYALPTLRGTLNDPNPLIRERSVQPITFIGWPAAELVPDLMLLAIDEQAPGSRMAVQAFSTMGPLAHKAVPVLEAVIMNTNRRDRESTLTMALTSLGAIGPAAARATPLLIPYLSSTNEFVRRAAIRAFAEIGTIQESALRELYPLAAQTTNQWHRELAMMALWQMERGIGDLALQAEVVAALEGQHGIAIASVLAAVGRHASVFKTNLQQMTQHTDPMRRDAARRALWWVEERWMR